MTLRSSTCQKALRGQGGFLLIGSIGLLAVITLLGITGFLLSSTDVKIGGNFRTNQGALEAAMAGAERGREQLRYANSVSAVNNASFSDDLAARVGPNAVLNGYAAGTDDVALTSGTVGSYSYTAYLTNDSADGLSNQTDTNQRVLITSVATGPNSSKAQVQIVVTFDPGPQIPAPVYTKGVFTGNGSSLIVSGNDNCTPPAPSLPPIYTKTPGYTDLNGTPTFTGSPSTPQQGSLDVDISTYIEQLKVGATVLTADQTNANFGSSTNFVTIYSDTSNPVNANGLKIQNGTGYGLLLVKGDLELGGGFNWNGVVLVTGTVTFNGGGGPNAINIRGAILSTQSVSANGDITVLYDSCMLKKSFHSKPLKIVTWKHVY